MRLINHKRGEWNQKVLILLLFLSANFIFSQSPSSNLKFVRYSTRMGLSNSNQRCITQDKEGFIWIGTDDGLNRFDGHTFKVYRKIQDDPSSLRSNVINCLFTDSQGILWVGTYAGGLSRYNKESDNFYTYMASIDSMALLNNDINTIAEDKNHRLWVGTSYGLHLFNPKTNGFIRFRTTSDPQSVSRTVIHNHVKKIIMDNEQLWIAYTSGMLSALNTSTMTFIHHKLFDVSSWNIADFSVNALVLHNQNIWISTWSKGIWIFNKQSGECHPYKKEKNQYINFIFKDNKNNIWYNPESEGLIMLDGKEESINYQLDDYDPYSLSSNSLSDIYQDRQGNLWLASKQGDLNYLIIENPFYSWYKNPNSSSGLTKNIITAVIEDSKKRVWVGFQDGGIDIIDSQNKYARYHIRGDQSTGLGGGAIMYIYESKEGTIWVGKYLDGLKKYHESSRSFSTYRHVEGNEASIAGNDVRYITEDSQGNLWLAIHGGGMDKFNPQSGKYIHHKWDQNKPFTTLNNDWTITAVCDRENDIWIGSIYGISVLSEKTAIVKHYVTNAEEGQNLSNDMAKIIFFDSKGYIWIGTNEGLNKLDQNSRSIKKYYTQNGLPNCVIMGILEDDHYNLWISTAKGLSKFSPETEIFKNYFIQNGLVTDEFITFVSFKNSNGEMYFGGRDGLIRFHPDSIHRNTYKPPVYIIDIKLSNQSIQVKKDSFSNEFSLPQQISFCKEITLRYFQNSITLGFVALNYLNLEENLYRYKLEGFEKDWTLPGLKREVTYSNLPPGDYTFRVIASNNDGIWNTEGASLKIIITPPFWRTKWAYMFYFIVIIIILYFFRKFILRDALIKRKLEFETLEVQKLQELDTLKMQFFANVSHEFRNPLTLIVGPLEKLIAGSRDEMEQFQLKLIKRNTNRLLRLINQLMDFRKIDKSELKLELSQIDFIKFIRGISSSFEFEALQRRMEFNFLTRIETLTGWFDTDKLDKIVYNVVSNAFKYTPDHGKIQISLSLEQEISSPPMVRVEVADNGIGIPKDALPKIFERFYQVRNSFSDYGTGIGLSLARELVTLHKGTISVKSELGKGSVFTIKMPVWEHLDIPQQDSILQAAEGIKGGMTHLESAEIEDFSVMEEIDEPSDTFPILMIIEDNPDMRLFIKSEFSESFRVFDAPDGMIGLEKAFETIPDAIICDVMMPGKNGFEVCHEIKTDERTSHIPVVLLTARDSEQDTIAGLDIGADDYIVKPFNSAILKARVKNLIESRQLLRKKFIKEPFASIKEFSPSSVDEKLLNKAYAIVEKNLNNPNFDVINFAGELSMSRTQLYRKIRAISGQSVKEFIRIIRLKKAAEMLLTSDLNISEVAYNVGFNSISYFTTSFTDYFEMNPTKYIEKYIK